MSYKPIVQTKLSNNAIEGLVGNKYVNFPGVPILVVFANCNYCYEEACLMHEKVNNQRLFERHGIIHHIVPPEVSELKRGMKLSAVNKPISKWWRSRDDGIVIKEGVTKQGQRYVSTKVGSQVVNIGDKFATAHGQKFVMSKILTSDQMFTFECTTTGTRFQPHFILAISAVVKRGTMGQLYEAWKSFNVVNDYDFDPRKPYAHTIVDDFTDENSDISPMTAYVLQPGTDQYVTRSGQRVIADFGIVHMHQLSHLSSFKQHYTSTLARSATVRRGRNVGGAPRFGEMELQSMFAAGMINCLSETLDNSDVVSVTICSSCRSLSMLCDCPGEAKPTIKVLTRESLLKLDIYRSVYTANAEIARLSDDTQAAMVDDANVTNAQCFTYLT
jgi:DNA-directed RNA polymerase beta subunit